MKTSSAIRTALIALVAFVGLSPASYADSGTVTLTIYKAGWIIGGSGGSGTLNFHGRYYRCRPAGWTTALFIVHPLRCREVENAAYDLEAMIDRIRRFALGDPIVDPRLQRPGMNLVQGHVADPPASAFATDRRHSLDFAFADWFART